MLATHSTSSAPARAGAHALGIATADPVKIAGQILAGFPVSRLTRLVKVSAIPLESVANYAAISQRTLARRMKEGRLHGDESDRVWRVAVIFDLAVDLFEGDVEGAKRWLQAPQPGLGGHVPLEFAATEVGAREVESLIGRLEHGIQP